MKKLTLKEYSWNGFNYIFNIAFMNYFATIVTGDEKNPGAGLYMLPAYILAALVSYVCIDSFKRLSNISGQKSSDGGAMIYCKNSINKTCGLLVGFVQYIFVPLVVCVQMNMMFKNIFSPEAVISSPDSIPWNAQYWGPFTNLYLDLIGMSLTLMCMALVLTGFKKFKVYTKWSGIIKWVIAFFFIAVSFYSACTNGASNMEQWAKNSHFSFYNFINIFNTSFYMLSGFEILVTVGKNVENPKKNIGKGINIVMLSSIFASLFFALILFLGFSKFTSNIDIVAWTQVFTGKLHILASIGIGFSAIALLLGYINAAIQNGLFANSTAEPLARAGFLPKKISILNKDGIAANAVKYMILFSFILGLLVLCVPDLIQGINMIEPLSHLNRNDAINYIASQKPIFDVTSLSQVASIFSLVIYVLVLFAAIKEKNKNLKYNNFLYSVYFMTMFILSGMFILHYYLEAYDVIYEKDHLPLVKLIVELVILTTLSVWFTTKVMIMKKRNLL